MRVLLVRAGALGDVLLLRRAIAALHADSARVTLVAPRPSGTALLGEGPSEVEALLDWDGPQVPALLAGSPAAISGLDGMDAALAYTRSAELADVLRPRVGRLVVHDPAPPAGVHAARWLSEAVRALGIATEDAPAPLRPTTAELEAAGPVLGLLGDGFLAVHPGAGSPAKRWPADRFAALVEALSAGRPWALVEGPADVQCAAPLAALPGSVRAVGLPVRVLGALLSRAGLYVGNDSGVSHLAAAVGTATLALFGPTDPRCWAPEGPAVHTLRGEDGTMAGLGTAAVIDAARTLAGREARLR